MLVEISKIGTRERDPMTSSKSPYEDPLKTIIANAKRLLSDAKILLNAGSPGSAMAHAILAFEETGKGNHYELNMEKTKRTPSWHQFRQVAAALVLTISLFQKYGIKQPVMSTKARELLEDRSSKAKKLADFAKEPVPEEFRDAIVPLIIEQGILDDLDEDQMLIFTVEQRWLKDVLLSAATGELEARRQSGIYVDLGDADDIKSSPLDVPPNEAVRWIDVAERALLLLDRGDYKAPYSPLAAILEGMPRPLPRGSEMERILNGSTGEVAT